MTDVKRFIEKGILKAAEVILPPIVFDRLLVERRRRVHRIEGYYPQSVVFSKGSSQNRYCVVRYTLPTMSLFASGIQYIFWYYWLKERGYIPIVDIEYAYSYMQGRLGERNCWDMCFKQPVTASEVFNEDYVIATGYGFPSSDSSTLCMELNGDASDHFIHVKQENFREYYATAHKLIEPIWQVRDEILGEYEQEIGQKMHGKRTLGVFLREEFSADVRMKGNSKTKEVYENHPSLPTVKETIEIIKTKLGAWKYDVIFLATLCEESVTSFREAFGENVIVINRNRIKYEEYNDRGWVFEMSEKELYDYGQKIDLENDMITYLKEVIALSRCDFFIGGASSGAAAALAMNGGKYEDVFILEDARKINRY